MDVDDIGEGNDAALLCHTDKTDCCNAHNRAGEWYYPNGTTVGIRYTGEANLEFYRDRGTRVVRLNHRQGISTERGCFRCEIPDSRDILQNIYINIGMCIAVTV